MKIKIRWADVFALAAMSVMLGAFTLYMLTAYSL